MNKYFTDAIEVFAEYVKADFGVNFDPPESNLRLTLNPDLGPEACTIESTGTDLEIQAATVKGAHMAFALLLSRINIVDGKIHFPPFHISQEPDFPYRGLMVDLARQWHPFPYLLKYIDLLYRNGGSHLQLHFTDFQGFTLPFNCYPKLAWEGRSYTKEEIALLNNYAAKRGIELVPEVDVPGHCGNFMYQYPDLFGNLDILPASDDVFDALRKIFGELKEMFPNSKMIHIGSDEANYDNWAYCDKTQKYMADHGIKDFKEMYALYVKYVTEMILELGVTPVVWEGFAKEYNNLISQDVIVMEWSNKYQSPKDLAEAGFTIINCSCDPLYIVTPDRHCSPEEISAWNPWSWRCWVPEPPNPVTLRKSSATLLGGQLCAWGDKIREYDDYEKGCRQELALIEERLPALCKKLIN